MVRRSGLRQNTQRVCCRQPAASTSTPTPVDPCADKAPPTVTGVTFTQVGDPVEDFCETVWDQSELTITIQFSEDVSGVDECDVGCPSCNIRFFRCPAADTQCGDPEAGDELTPTSVAYDPTTFTATILLSDVGDAPDIGQPQLVFARLVVGDGDDCPILGVACEDELTAFRCDFSIQFLS